MSRFHAPWNDPARLLISPSLHRIHHSTIVATRIATSAPSFPGGTLFGTYARQPSVDVMEMETGLEVTPATQFERSPHLTMPFKH